MPSLSLLRLLALFVLFASIKSFQILLAPSRTIRSNSRFRMSLCQSMCSNTLGRSRSSLVHSSMGRIHYKVFLLLQYNIV